MPAAFARGIRPGFSNLEDPAEEAGESYANTHKEPGSDTTNLEKAITLFETALDLLKQFAEEEKAEGEM